MDYEILTIEQLKDMEHEGFTPLFEYLNYNDDEKVYYGVKIIKTAQEVYDEWLENKDKPVEPQPSTDDKIIVLQAELCKMELEMMRLKG